MKSLFTILALLITTTASAQGLLPELKRLRAEYPTPLSKAQIGELLTRTAQFAPGWALLAKPAGNNCPAMGTKVSCDYIVDANTGQGYDVLLDSEGAATPRWNKGTMFSDRSRFVSVGTVVIIPPTPPVVPPVTPPVVDNGLRELLEKALARIDILVARETPICPAVVFPNYRGGILGMGITLRPE